MHLVLHHVAEFQHVNNTHRCRLVKPLAGTAVIQVSLTITGKAGFVCPFIEVIKRGTVENRGCELLAKLTPRPSEHGLENLAEVHTRRHTKRVQTDINRRTVGKERHILLANNPRHDTFVTVAAGHLVAHTDFTLLGDINFGNLHDAGRQLVTYRNIELLAAQFGINLLRLAQIVDDELADKFVFMVVSSPFAEVNSVEVNIFQSGGSELATLRDNVGAEEIFHTL